MQRLFYFTILPLQFKFYILRFVVAKLEKTFGDRIENNVSSYATSFFSKGKSFKCMNV